MTFDSHIWSFEVKEEEEEEDSHLKSRQTVRAGLPQVWQWILMLTTHAQCEMSENTAFKSVLGLVWPGLPGRITNSVRGQLWGSWCTTPLVNPQSGNI